MTIETVNRIKGTIYGQAIGNALGLGTEFMDSAEMAQKYPKGLKHYNKIYQDRHRSRWDISDWTDDTDMMLCIANHNEELRLKIDNDTKALTYHFHHFYLCQTHTPSLYETIWMIQQGLRPSIFYNDKRYTKSPKKRE